MTRTFRLGVIASHPIQYLAPFYRALSQRERIQLQVYFLTDFGQRPSTDPGFGVAYAWDVDLTSGYEHTYLENHARRPSPRFWGSDCPAIRAILQRDGIDAVLLPGYKCRGYLQAKRAAADLGLPLLFRGECGDHVPRPALKAIVRDRFLRRFFAGIDAFLPIGHQAERHFRRLGVPDSALFPSPYCVDNERFVNESDRLRSARAQHRADFGIPDDGFVLVVPGKLTAGKAPLDALRAAARAARPNLWLLFVGDGPMRVTLERTARELAFSRFTITGFLNQTRVVGAYVAGDLLLLSSHHETWGVVVNEGMACGLPAIVTDCTGCAPDLIQEGETGFVYPVGDVSRLTELLRVLANDPARVSAMGRAARRHVVERFEPAAAAEGVELACRHLATTTGRG